MKDVFPTLYCPTSITCGLAVLIEAWLDDDDGTNQVRTWIRKERPKGHCINKA